MRRKRILIASDYYRPGYKAGGPIKSLENLINLIGDIYDVTLVTSKKDLGSNHSYSDAEILETERASRAHLIYSRSNFSVFYEYIRNDYDIIYLNSFFSKRSIYFMLLIKLFSIMVGKRYKLIIAPRGELTFETLQMKKFKKSMFLKFYRMLKLNAVFHATSTFEKKNIDAILNTSSEMVPNLIGSKNIVMRSELGNKKDNTFVFLSRISPKKNLDKVISALADVHTKISLDIYGPVDDESYFRKCVKLAENLRGQHLIRFNGAVNNKDVQRTLMKYEFFILVSESENFGHVIFESLCAGLVPIITKNSPFTEVEEFGFVVDPRNITQITNAILSCSAISADEYAQLNKKQTTYLQSYASDLKYTDAYRRLFDECSNSHSDS